MADASNPRIGLLLTGEKFEALLTWLDSDCEAAGREYTKIQRGLIGLFAAKGFSDAEGLADETINRVADRLPEIGPDYQGARVRYFRGVAHNIIYEANRRKEVPTDSPPERPTKQTDASDEYDCLLKCLQFLPYGEREFILDYHVYNGAEKIANHEAMAKEKRISVNTLRVQAHRLRARIEKCVLECVEQMRKK